MLQLQLSMLLHLKLPMLLLSMLLQLQLSMLLQLHLYVAAVAVIKVTVAEQTTDRLSTKVGFMKENQKNLFLKLY